MKYKKITLLLLSGILFVGSVSVFGTTISNLQNEQEEIEGDIEDAQNVLEEIQSNLSDAQVELSNLDIELSKAESEYNNVKDQLNEAELQLLQAEAELAEAVKVKDTQYETLKTRLAYMYEYGDVSYIEILFGSSSIYDMFNRVEYISIIAEYDRNLLSAYEEQEKLVEAKVKEIEQKKAEIEKLYVEAEVKKENLETKYAEKESMIRTMEADEQEQENMINQLRQANAEVENRIKQEQARAEEALRQAQQSGSATTTYTGGQLGWPVIGYSYISSGFIDRANPVTGKAEFHKGIDIPAPTGTSIVAAESGVVIDARYMNGYGYGVIISHGNGISTLYGHNSELLVSNGDVVNKGDVIARAGSTGNSTGPHCHFEVRIDGVATDPMPYVY